MICMHLNLKFTWFYFNDSNFSCLLCWYTCNNFIWILVKMSVINNKFWLNRSQLVWGWCITLIFKLQFLYRFITPFRCNFYRKDRCITPKWCVKSMYEKSESTPKIHCDTPISIPTGIVCQKILFKFYIFSWKNWLIPNFQNFKFPHWF